MHPVLTKDFPENKKHGLMICGINFGYSVDDQMLDERGFSQSPEEMSYFSDIAVNQSQFRNRILRAFSLWGVPLETDTDKVSAFERSIFQTNWLDTQTNDAEGIELKKLVESSDKILKLIAERQPRLILFFGRQLIEAFNDVSLRAKVQASLGARSGNGHILKLPNPNGKKVFEVVFQSFGDTQIICFPHITGAQGLSDDYIARFSDSIGGAIMKWRGIYFYSLTMGY